MEFQREDKVFLMLSIRCVRIGLVLTMDETRCCGGSLIGKGNASIFLEECWMHVDLPFHTMDTRELQCAIWSVI